MKKILVISDLHIGSTVSVMPDDVWTVTNLDQFAEAA